MGNDGQASNSREHVFISRMPEHVEDRRYNLAENKHC